MSSTSNIQTVEREAQDSSVRSVNEFRVSGRQMRKARSVARQIETTKEARQQAAALITSALAAFGGHITGFTPAQ